MVFEYTVKWRDTRFKVIWQINNVLIISSGTINFITSFFNMSGESPHTIIVKRTGEAIAIDEVYKRCYSILFAKAYSILGSQERANDAVQELFLRILERKKGLIIETSLEAYLMVMIHNDCLRLLTKDEYLRKKHKGYLFSIQQDEPEQLPLESSSRQDALKVIEEGKKQLSKNQQEVIKKCVEEDKSYRQVAEEMNIARNTVQSHIERAFSKFRNLFKEKCGPSL
jgi:RNA polymerase sigma-70 factor (ECF subfamily)